jgi:hypothetical protein
MGFLPHRPLAELAYENMVASHERVAKEIISLPKERRATAFAEVERRYKEVCANFWFDQELADQWADVNMDTLRHWVVALELTANTQRD